MKGGGIGGSGGKPPIGCCVSKPPGDAQHALGGRMPMYYIAVDMPCEKIDGTLDEEAASSSSTFFFNWVASSLYL